MSDINALLGLFQELSLEELEQFHDFIHKNRNRLQSQMGIRDEHERITALGRTLLDFRQQFAASHPGWVDPDKQYREQRLAELLAQMSQNDS